MSSTGDRKSKADAERMLRHCVAHGIVQFIPHFYQRCSERGIGIQDVIGVLSRGFVYLEPELDVRRNQWRCKVEGRTSEGEGLAVIVTFADEDTTVVITAVSP